MWWGGWDGNSFIAWPESVRMVIGIYDVSENQFTPLKDEIINSPFSTFIDTNSTNFGNCPNLSIPVDYHVTMDAGDSYLWSAMPLAKVNKGCWITLNDDQMRISHPAEAMPQVPEPGTAAMLFSFIIPIGFRLFRKNI